MQFHYSEPRSELEKLLGGFFCINAIGTIEHGDDVKFKSFLEAHNPPSHMTVYIDSTGGDLQAGFGIGRLIREYGLWTAIGQRILETQGPTSLLTAAKHIEGQCMSAATMVYIGGRLRHFSQGSKFGVHRFSFKNPVPEHLGQSQMLSAQIASFVGAMGVSTEFMELSSATDAAEINLVSESRLKELDVITGGETDVEWTVQARGKMIYVKGERDSIFGRHKVMVGFAKEIGFFFWAVIEAQNRYKELTENGLVEIVLKDDKVSIDISEDCLRYQIGTDVQVFVKITNDQARAISQSSGFGIQIRVSPESPMFLGISPMPTDGGVDQLEALFHNFS